MKKNSVVTVVSIIIGALILIVGIFKVMPLIVGSHKNSSDQEMLVTEEIVEVVEPDNNQAPMNNAPSASCSVVEISSPEQIDQLSQSTRPMVIKFYAPWCGACQYVNTFYGDVAQALPGVEFYSIDVGNKNVMARVEQTALLEKQVEYLPTFVYRTNGRVVQQTTGAQEKAIMIEAIKQALNS